MKTLCLRSQDHKRRVINQDVLLIVWLIDLVSHSGSYFSAALRIRSSGYIYGIVIYGACWERKHHAINTCKNGIFINIIIEAVAQMGWLPKGAKTATKKTTKNTKKRKENIEMTDNSTQKKKEKKTEKSQKVKNATQLKTPKKTVRKTVKTSSKSVEKGSEN